MADPVKTDAKKADEKKEAKAVVVENADLQLCNLIHRGMSMKEAKAKLGIK